jgi:hypothetical protein
MIVACGRLRTRSGGEVSAAGAAPLSSRAYRAMQIILDLAPSGRISEPRTTQRSSSRRRVAARTV